MSTSNLKPEDKKAALTGLVITAISLFVMAYAIVLYTNSLFADGAHGKAAPAAETKH